MLKRIGNYRILPWQKRFLALDGGDGYWVVPLLCIDQWIPEPILLSKEGFEAR